MDLWKQRLAFFVAGAAVVGGLWSFCGAVRTENGSIGAARVQDAGQGETLDESQDGPRSED